MIKGQMQNPGEQVDHERTVRERLEERFVSTVISLCKNDKAFSARLRRADNANMEYQSWDFLVRMGIDLEKDYKRVPFAVIGAAIAKSKIDRNGDLSMGRALASCYDTGNDSSPAQARLRRLLSCETTEEVCRILRTVFSLIHNKVAEPLDYARILRQLIYFHLDQQRIKAEWAQEFYSYRQQNQES
jgi:CRISPR system Cascade subunit CasB